MYIKYSVGKGGKNHRNDVGFVQSILSLISEEDFRIPCLDADGLIGPKTNKAIHLFQQHYVKLKMPDSRIDPNGRTEKLLVAKCLEIDKAYLKTLATKYQLTKSISPTVHSKGRKTIHYRKNAKRVLSVYTENIIKVAMSFAEINKCDISSTIRTFDDQVRIMYNNCGKFPNATSVATLRKARGWGYAAAGRAVEEVYFQKKSSGESATKKAMKEKVEELYKEGTKVSLHCVSKSDYNIQNVLDIPYSSVVSTKKKDFEIALMGMTQNIKNARYAQPIKGEIYIERMIIEDRCWHLEIKQLNKPLPLSKKADSIPKKTLAPRSGAITMPGLFDSIVCLLDDEHW